MDKIGKPAPFAKRTKDAAPEKSKGKGLATRPLGDYPYGNEQKKQEMIKAGIEYYKHGCWLTFNRPI